MNTEQTSENIFTCFYAPTKKKCSQPVSIKKFLDDLKISKDDYYRALSISKDENFASCI